MARYDLTIDAGIEAYCEDLAKAGTEHAHQRAFFAWLNVMQYQDKHSMARMAFAIPNGGFRDKITAGKLKAEGVKAGVADICYPLPQASNGYLSLWLEMKKPKVGRSSAEQSDWAIDMRVCGHAVSTCWGWRAARQAFIDYSRGCLVQEEYA